MNADPPESASAVSLRSPSADSPEWIPARCGPARRSTSRRGREATQPDSPKHSGFDLEISASEHPVGGVALDLIGRDVTRASGHSPRPSPPRRRRERGALVISRAVRTPPARRRGPTDRRPAILTGDDPPERRAPRGAHRWDLARRQLLFRWPSRHRPSPQPRAEPVAVHGWGSSIVSYRAGVWRVAPRRVLTWQELPRDSTRFTF